MTYVSWGPAQGSNDLSFAIVSVTERGIVITISDSSSYNCLKFK